MSQLTINTDSQVDQIFDDYPIEVRSQMKALRALVHETAKEMPEIQNLTEILKWGEPSFVTKIGSTIRMDWKEKSPYQYAMYFQCTSRLVETFKLVFGDLFNYEGKRAIVFQLSDDVPVHELKQCIKAALRYHKVKSEGMLGM